MKPAFQRLAATVAVPLLPPDTAPRKTRVSTQEVGEASTGSWRDWCQTGLKGSEEIVF